MLVIYTRTNRYFSVEWIKWFLHTRLKRYRGPDAVLRSIVDGLHELAIPFLLNPRQCPAGATVLVLSGVQSLCDMIQAKERGDIKKLVAGPNIVVFPSDADSILLDTRIDKVLVPSEWVRICYQLFGDFEFKKKIVVWAAGVKKQHVHVSRTRSTALIYKKNCPNEIFESVCKVMDDNDIEYRIMQYGTLSQKEYLRLLHETRFMVYLQSHESQGLAMFEAWAADIPSLHWESGMYHVEPLNCMVYGNISAPYVSTEVGDVFESVDTFEDKLHIFLSRVCDMSPKKWINEHFSDTMTTGRLLSILGIHVQDTRHFYDTC